MIETGERAREVEGKEGDDGRCSKAGAKTKYAMTTSVAEEANALSVGDNGACSDGRSGEDKCSSCKGARTRNRGSSETGPLCNEGGLEKELLCL